MRLSKPTDISEKENMYRCNHCKKDINLRNPSGYCDHLYYPENCNICSNPDNMTPTTEIENEVKKKIESEMKKQYAKMIKENVEKFTKLNFTGLEFLTQTKKG